MNEGQVPPPKLDTFPFADLAPLTLIPTPAPTLPAPATISCSAQLDVILVVDGSTSVGADAFADLKLFLMQFVGSFNMSEQAVEVGITHFSSADVFVNSPDGAVSEVVSPLSAFRANVMDAIDGMMYGGGRRYTAAALREAVVAMRPQRRPGVPAVYVVITDGFPSDMEDLHAAAEEVRADGRLVFSVVGVAGLAQQLSYVVSAPYDSSIFIEERYNSLLEKVPSYVAALCPA
jgi:Mg-chelatase subunit ChlD